MTIVLTDKQVAEIKTQNGKPIEFRDPVTDSLWYLVPAEQYETVQEPLEDEREQRAIHAFALQNLAKRIKQDEME